MQNRVSLSSVLSDLVVRGLAQRGEHTTLTVDPRSGFPTFSIGRPITSDEVADLIDEDSP